MRLTFRTAVNFALAVFALTVLASFTFAIYLMIRPGVTVGSGLRGGPSFEELLAEGRRYLARRQAEQALFAYRRARALRPDSADAQIGVARGEVLAGRHEDAAAEYERALLLAPENAPIVLDLAILYSHRRVTWRLAEDRFTRYLVLRPDDVDAQLRLARVLAWSGEAVAAAEIFARPAVSRVMTVEDHTAHAFALVAAERMRDAEGVITRLVAHGHRDPRLIHQLADIYGARRDWNAAFSLYRELLQQAPHDPRLNLSYGHGLLAVRRYADAVEPLRIATRAFHGDGAAGLAYARALKGAGQRTAAAREFERVMPRFAGNAPVAREYADLLFELKQYRPAERYYKRALALGLEDVRLYLALSGTLRATHRPREAVPYLQEAYRRAPTERLGFDLAHLLSQAGQKRQALALLDSLPASGARSASVSAP